MTLPGEAGKHSLLIRKKTCKEHASVIMRSIVAQIKGYPLKFLLLQLAVKIFLIFEK
jgi:hypothetical protein